MSDKKVCYRMSIHTYFIEIEFKSQSDAYRFITALTKQGYKFKNGRYIKEMSK